ncbi:MAG: hypothetical protein AAF497_21550 [Planctomycetota bacterium]
MSYYFTCAVINSELSEVASPFLSREISQNLFLIWRPDAPRVPVASDADDFCSVLESHAETFLYIMYDDGAGVRTATILTRGVATQSFGDSDELWLPLDDSGFADRTAEPVPSHQLDDDEEYDLIQCGISLALDTFCGAGRISVAEIRQVICHGNP